MHSALPEGDLGIASLIGQLPMEVATDVYLDAALRTLPIPQLQHNPDSAPSSPSTQKLLWLECASSILSLAPLPSSLTFHEPTHNRRHCQRHAPAGKLEPVRTNSISTGSVSAFDCHNGVLHVRKLTSPIGTYTGAFVRLSDTDRVDMDGVSLQIIFRLCHLAQSHCRGDTAYSGPSAPLVPHQHTQYEANPFGKDVQRYWSQRHTLFSRFDRIRTDREGLFSATPECVAFHVGRKLLESTKFSSPSFVVGDTEVPGSQEVRCITILDAFCGIGGNCIHFARLSSNFRVIAVDINMERLEMARHNAAVYGVEDRIEFICGDFLHLAPSLRADVVVLSPPWGGPDYQQRSDNSADTYDLKSVITIPCEGSVLLRRTLSDVSDATSVIYMLPKDVDKRSLHGYSPGTEIEDLYVNGMKKMTISYHFGGTVTV